LTLFVSCEGIVASKTITMSWEDEEVEAPLAQVSLADPSRWADEDREEGNTKESWEQEDQQQPPQPQAQPQPQHQQQKRSFRKPGVVPPQGPPQDPEGEKKYKQLMVEAADFENTREMFSGLDVIDTKHPKDEKDFEALATLLAQKLAIFDKSYHFKEFLKSLYRQTAASLKSDDIKELSSVLGMVANEKMKSEKEKQKKKKSTWKKNNPECEK